MTLIAQHAHAVALRSLIDEASSKAAKRGPLDQDESPRQRANPADEASAWHTFCSQQNVPGPSSDLAAPSSKSHITLTASDVTTADASIQASTVWTIVLGFAADPLMRWSWPDLPQYLASMPQFISGSAGRAFEHGTAYAVAHSRAVALWLPPGVQQDEEALNALMAMSLSPDVSEDMAHLRRGMAEHRPAEPHWYLPLIAADPNWVGQGLGTLLMKHALQRCDEQGSAAYLESSNPKNIPFYQRHGFKIIGEIQHGGSPPLTPMLRTRS